MLLVEVVRAPEVGGVEQERLRALEERRPRPAPEPVAHGVAEDGRGDEHQVQVDDVQLPRAREDAGRHEKRVARQEETDEQAGLGEDDERHRGQSSDADQSLDVGQVVEELLEPLHGRAHGSRLG